MITVDSRAKDFLTASEISRFLEAARKGKHGVRDYLLGLMAYRHGLRVTELIRIRMDDIDLDDGRMFVRRMKGSMSTSHPMQGDEVRAVRAWLRERKRFLPVPVLAEPTDAIGSHKPESEARESIYCETSRRSNPKAKSDSRGGQKLSQCSRAGNGDNDLGGHEPLGSVAALGTNAARNGDDTQGANASPCTVDDPASGNQFSGSDGQNREVRHGLSDFSRHASGSELLFINEKRRPFGRTAINYLFHEIGVRAGLGHVHPHMMRHACGYALANKGCDTRLIQDYLGHKDIHNTERYTRTSAARFERLWE